MTTPTKKKKSLTDSLAINKKGDKVKIVGKARFYNLAGKTLQFAPLLTYLAVEYNLFSYVEGTNAGYKITGWGFFFACVLGLIFRDQFREWIKKYDESLGETWQRSKSGTTALIITLILFITYFISYNLMWILGIYGVSTFASLYFYAPYDKLNVKRKAIQEELDKKTKENDYETLMAEYQAKQQTNNI